MCKKTKPSLYRSHLVPDLLSSVWNGSTWGGHEVKFLLNCSRWYIPFWRGLCFSLVSFCRFPRTPIPGNCFIIQIFWRLLLISIHWFGSSAGTDTRNVNTLPNLSGRVRHARHRVTQVRSEFLDRVESHGLGTYFKVARLACPKTGFGVVCSRHHAWPCSHLF